jgi:hypothetical protein
MSKFAEGYQAAMRDIDRALTAGGEEAVREWLSANLIEPPLPLHRGKGGRFTTDDEAADNYARTYVENCDGDDCARRDCELHYMNAPLRLAPEGN